MNTAVWRAAAIDIGTNTLKLTVGEVDSERCVKILADERLGARLGEGVGSSGKLSAECQQRALGAMQKLMDQVHEIGVDRLRVVATSAMRDAANRDEFIELVQKELGVSVEVLSEQDEALLSYKAVALDPELGDINGKLLVFDVGGGSTELALGTREGVLSAKSLRIGAVRLTERFLASDPPTGGQLADVSTYVDEAVESAVDDKDVDTLLGVGGTIVNLAAMVHGVPVAGYSEVHDLKLTRNQVRDNLKLISSLPLSERKNITGLEPDRADVIVGGVVIVDRVMEMLGKNEVTVSIKGLRYGVLYDLMGSGQDDSAHSSESLDAAC